MALASRSVARNSRRRVRLFTEGSFRVRSATSAKEGTLIAASGLSRTGGVGAGGAFVSGRGTASAARVAAPSI